MKKEDPKAVVLVLFESIVGVPLIFAMLFCLIYVVNRIVEKRVVKFIKLIRVVNLFCLSMDVIGFIAIPAVLQIIAFFTHVAYFFLLNRGFPFIKLGKKECIFSLIGTITTQAAFMIYFLSTNRSTLFTISSFVIHVWIVPLMCVCAFMKQDSRRLKTGFWTFSVNNMFNYYKEQEKNKNVNA